MILGLYHEPRVQGVIRTRNDDVSYQRRLERGNHPYNPTYAHPAWPTTPECMAMRRRSSNTPKYCTSPKHAECSLFQLDDYDNASDLFRSLSVRRDAKMF